MARIEDMLQKLLRGFYATYENIKEMRSNMYFIGKKADSHPFLIKHLGIQMTQLSITVNSHQPCTLPSNTIQNLKNDVDAL